MEKAYVFGVSYWYYLEGQKIGSEQILKKYAFSDEVLLFQHLLDFAS